MFKFHSDKEDKISKLSGILEKADAVVIGAGAGLSTAAGYVYTGENFEKYFSDFGQKYGFRDMYSGGFWPYRTPEEMWAYWSRYIYVNRYLPVPSGLYSRLYRLVCSKDYFVITTNVDHCFQRAGFDHERLFYTQGDYGLFQCSEPCHEETYDNKEIIEAMIKDQGYEILEDGSLSVPEGTKLKMEISSDLIPVCPKCGKPMTMNLRSDDTFVEDEGWHRHAAHYTKFLQEHSSLKTLFLELGVGYNTPVIIKYPFWQMTHRNPDATYVCINKGEADVPSEIRSRSVCINADIAEVIQKLEEYGTCQ